MRRLREVGIPSRHADAGNRSWGDAELQDVLARTPLLSVRRGNIPRRETVRMEVSASAFDGVLRVCGALAAIILLTGCEPERGIRATWDLAGRIDVDCVEQSLQRRFDAVHRNDYESEGYVFPRGTDVAQFTYYGPGSGVAWIEVGAIPNGTRIAHSFTTVGWDIPQQAFPPALARMREATAGLLADCRIDLRQARFTEIGQNVDALHP
jgi:hypothetical protein